MTQLFRPLLVVIASATHAQLARQIQYLKVAVCAPQFGHLHSTAGSLRARLHFGTGRVTLKGIRDAFVLAFINLKTRQVIISPATLHPNETWVIQQADAFVTEARQRGLRVRRIQHDRDTKLSAAFTDRLKRRPVKSQRSSFCAPNMNAYVERFIQTLRKECLDHFVILGTKHLDHLCREFATHYHEERPHQSLDNEPIVKPPNICPMIEPVKIENVRCKQRLGGLLKSYSRKAA